MGKLVMSESFWWGKDIGRVGMGMVTISFKTRGREGFEPINDSRPSLCVTTPLWIHCVCRQPPPSQHFLPGVQCSRYFGYSE